MNHPQPSARDEAPSGASFKRWKLWILPLALLGAVFFVSQIYLAPKPSEMPIISTIPEWELINQSGQPFGSRDLRGKVYIAQFVFSRCPSVCPKMIRHMATVQQRLSGKKGVAIVSFTVDPDYDTPPVLLRLAADYKADVLTWTFVTGTDKDAMFELFRDGFKVNAHGAKDLYDIAHSEKIVLVDQLGQLRNYYGHDPAQIDQLLVDIDHLLEKPATTTP